MILPNKLSPVVYKGALKDKVDAFNALPDVSGSYWELTTDGALSDLKKAIKDHYLIAQDYTCAYCRQRIEVTHNGAWDAEHVVPKDTHPRFMFEPRNLCISCRDCNNNKSNKNVLVNKRRVRYPDKSEDYLVFHPHYDDYDEHVSVLSVAGFYLPKTDKGRALVEVCGLLRFLYKFSSFQSVSDDLKIKMGKLQSLLMEANDSVTENYILDCIEDLAKRGKEASRRKLMQELMA